MSSFEIDFLLILKYLLGKERFKSLKPNKQKRIPQRKTLNL